MKEQKLIKRYNKLKEDRLLYIQAHNRSVSKLNRLRDSGSTFRRSMMVSVVHRASNKVDKVDTKLKDLKNEIRLLRRNNK